MVRTAPIADLDRRFSSPGAKASSWADARRRLREADGLQLSTVRPDGGPHVVRRDPMSWAAHVLREQGMPALERHAVFGTDDPRTLRQYLDLHRERLEERLMDQRAVLECIEGLLIEAIRTRSPGTATESVDEATCVRDRARDWASAVEA